MIVRAGLGAAVAIVDGMPTRLDTIVTRQRKSRTRDLMFAAFIAMIVALGATSVGIALDASDAIVAKR